MVPTSANTSQRVQPPLGGGFTVMEMSSQCASPWRAGTLEIKDRSPGTQVALMLEVALPAIANLLANLAWMRAE